MFFSHTSCCDAIGPKVNHVLALLHYIYRINNSKFIYYTRIAYPGIIVRSVRFRLFRRFYHAPVRRFRL